ncbi:MAG: metallophosphoesterase family protein [Gammaproteobacteria bacterium]|nr:metallophosphoesterase family protein [Gammaproteobacteria bacterium]
MEPIAKPLGQIISVVSDTHGLMRPEAIAALRETNLIIHAGDIGSPDVLERLRELAPVVAIRGNIDRALWAMDLAETEVVQVNDALVYVLHDVQELDLDPEAAGFCAVISGHTHNASIKYRGDILYLNPGSIGPRRFSLPITFARLHVEGHTCSAEIVELSA